MRVLHVIPSVSPARGGPSAAVLAMVRALRGRGVEAEIAATNDDGDAVLPVPLDRRSEFQGVPVRFFARFSPRFRPVREFAFSRPLAAWLSAHTGDYDLLHVHALFSFVSTYAMRLARARRVPYICRPLGQLNDWAIRHRGFKKRFYLAVAERANLRGAAGVHFTTTLEQKEAAGVEPALRGFVVPHGTDIPGEVLHARLRLRERLGLPPGRLVVLFIGRVHPVKGLEILIPALGRITGVDFSFVLVGDADSTEYGETVRSMIQAHGLTERTCRLPFASGEWKQTLLQGADVFALTSHSENFGMAVVEAMAARLPVIVTPGVALAGLVEQRAAGLVVPLAEPAVAAALQQLLQDPARAQAMGAAGRRVVESDFAWPSVAERLHREYERCLARSGATEVRRA